MEPCFGNRVLEQLLKRRHVATPTHDLCILRVRASRPFRYPKQLVTNARTLQNWSHWLRTIIGPLLTVIVFIAAMLVLRHSIHHIALADVLRHWRKLPHASITLAVGLTS